MTSSLPRGVVGNDAADLRGWLQGLAGCPPITHSLSLRCPAHGPDGGTWFYVEADPVAAVARRRCVACARVWPLLDSAEHWTFPAMHTCGGCGQALFELAVGVHAARHPGAEAALAGWLALGGRCVACGQIEGLTDLVVPDIPLADLAEQL